jgi:hypothetical protein
MVIVLRLGSTCKFMVFWIISGNTCSKRFEQERKLTQRHWWITKLRSQMFLHVDKGLYPLQMYRTKSSKNHWCVSSPCLLRFVEPKNVVIVDINNATFFFPCDAFPSHGVKPTWGFHKVKLQKVETWKHAPSFQL